MHADVLTVRAGGLREFTRIPSAQNGQLGSGNDIGASKDETVVRPASSPFSATGGLKLLARAIWAAA